MKNKLYHVDLYRLDDINTDFDLEDYINSDGVSVIEWPFKVKDLLPNEYLMVSFTVLDNDQRKNHIEAKGDFYESVVRYL